MCAIFGSKYLHTIPRLAQKNATRGSMALSVTTLVIQHDKVHVLGCHRGLGKFPKKLKKIPHGDYYLCHVQAPTSAKLSIETTHPAEYEEAHLWHNGIIHKGTLDDYEGYGTSAWDTWLFLKEMQDKGIGCALQSVKGSFACAHIYNGHFQLFRNEKAPLYITRSMCISSEKIKGSEELKPFTFYGFSKVRGFSQTGKFSPTTPVFYGL